MTIDVEKTIGYWLASAAYDLETGKTLLRSGKYPYALFFGHLAIEKVLKALVVSQTGDHAPFSHSLVVLAGKSALEIPEDMIDQLAEFMEFHTEARYPDAKMDFYQKCTKEFAQEKFKGMKEVYTWLLKKFEK
jgi:HEPN domain-containing protein